MGEGLVESGIYQGEGSMPHAGSSLGRVLTPGVQGISPVMHTDPSRVLFGACSEAEIHYYFSWVIRGEGMNIGHWTPQTLMSCSPFYLQQKLKCEDIAEVCPEGPLGS